MPLELGCGISKSVAQRKTETTRRTEVCSPRQSTPPGAPSYLSNSSFRLADILIH